MGGGDGVLADFSTLEGRPLFPQSPGYQVPGTTPELVTVAASIASTSSSILHALHLSRVKMTISSLLLIDALMYAQWQAWCAFSEHWHAPTRTLVGVPCSWQR